GRYDVLGDVVVEAVTERADELTAETVVAELAGAAGLSALHCGRPVPIEVRTVLAGRGPIEFCDRWFAGGDVALEEFAACFGDLTRGWPGDEPASSRYERIRRHRPPACGVDQAFLSRNLVPVFEWLLGPVYW